MSSDDKVAYIKENSVHHIFEVLASRVLAAKPKDVYKFISEEALKLQDEEKGTHDPTVLLPAQTNGVPSNIPKKSVTFAVFGLDNAGKTVLVSALSGEIQEDPMPTVGFIPTQFSTERHHINLFDLGGGRNFRGIWTEYYADLHGVIYVVDSSDQTKFKESEEVLAQVMGDERMKGKPLLVYANKRDLAKKKGGADSKEIFNVLKLNNVPTQLVNVVECTAITPDPNVEQGVEWLLTTVDGHFDLLDERVKKQIAEQKALRRKKLAEQLARVEERKAEEEEEAAKK